MSSCSRQGVVESTRPDMYIAASVASDGTAAGHIGPCPEGFVWYVERLTCFQSGAGVSSNALLEVYVLPVDSSGTLDASKQGRQDIAVGTDVRNDVSDQLSPVTVPPGYFLVAKWSGLTSADRVTLSSQIQVRRLVLERHQPGRHPHTMEHSPDTKATAMVGVGFNPPDQDAEL